MKVLILFFSLLVLIMSCSSEDSNEIALGGICENNLEERCSSDTTAILICNDNIWVMYEECNINLGEYCRLIHEIKTYSCTDDTGNSGNTGDIGNTGDTGDSGNTGDAGNSGNTASDDDIGNTGSDEDIDEVVPDEDAGNTTTDEDIGDTGSDGDIGNDDEENINPTVICTGADKCFNDTAEMSCPSIGDEFYGQDTQYEDIGYCLSVNYTTYAETVVDVNTGLEWQRMPPTEKYTWQGAVDYCDNLDFNSHVDWRLPDIYELETLVDYGKYDPSINSSSFPDTSSGCFWSYLSYLDNTDYAWSADFEKGSSTETRSKTGTCVLRCVRGDAFPVHVFTEKTINGNVVVKDSITDLEWTKDYAENKTWKEALSYCENLNYGGYTNWRLPNINEIKSIRNLYKVGPTSDFPGFPSGADHFWSSSSFVHDNGYAWRLISYSGGINSYTKAGIISVLCVRNKN